MKENLRAITTVPCVPGTDPSTARSEQPPIRRGMMMELLTVEEVAQTLKLSKSMVYLLCQQGKLPTVRFGKSVRVPGPALEAWLREQIRTA